MNRLWVRLTLSFLLLAWLSVAAMAVMVQRTTESGFRQYLNRRSSGDVSATQISRLEAYYAGQRSWNGAETVFSIGRGARNGGGQGASFQIADTNGVIVVADDHALLGSKLETSVLESAIPLQVAGAQVGWFVRYSPGQEALGNAELAFLAEANRALMITGIVVSAAAVAAGISLSWLLVHPLDQLTVGIRDIASRRTGQTMKLRTTTEFQEVADAFNHMSAQLAESERLRQRMSADIAHELRTPVSVLRGHLEAMRDGIFPLDQEHLAVVHDQTLTLEYLVNDLRVLTLAEARHLPLKREIVRLSTMTTDLIERFRPLALDARIALDFSPVVPEIYVQGDEQRLQQVLSNLLMNALRYTAAQGKVRVEIKEQDGQARIRLCNTIARPLPTQVLDRLFDPFWRAPEGQQRDSGGSGLGLAIARQLTELHDGSLTAEQLPGTLCFTMSLPAHPKP